MNNSVVSDFVADTPKMITIKNNQDMKKYSKLIIAAIIALIFIGTFVFLWQKSQPKEVVYNEFTPTTENIQKTTIITGKIEPRNEVNIKPQISGIISELLKEPGDYVNAGDVIAKVKVIPDMAQLSSAEMRVRLADINLKQAEIDFQREENLFNQKLVSADEYDKTKIKLTQAQHEKSAALDALEVVRDGVSKSNAKASSTLVRSTISGVILDIPVKVGNSVILSNTQLVSGMPMKITIGALQDLSFDAALEYISPKAVESNGANQFEIKAAVTVPADSVGGKSGHLRSGYSANAEIVLSHADKVLSIPESAIEFSGDSTFVYVVKGEGKNKTYDRTYVETGLSDGVNIEIKKGITAKDKVRGPEIVTDDKEK